MGDLVRSERDGVARDMHRHFNAAVDHANGATGPASPLTITLGDEFQGLFVSLVEAAEAARMIRFALMERDIECRFAIGVARLDTPLNTARAWNMMGRGLADTRARLDEKRPATLYRFVFPDDPVLETLLDAIGATLTRIERDWTLTQRRYILPLLAEASAAEVARAQGVSVHNVYKVRGAGNFDLYRQQREAVRIALAELDTRDGPVEAC